MSFETDMVTYLEAHAGLAALVSDRIYVGRIDDANGDDDCLVFQVVGGRELRMADYVEPRILFGSWSKNFLTAVAIDAQLRDALEAYHGNMGTTHVRVRTDPGGDDFEEDTGWCRRKRYARPLYRHA